MKYSISIMVLACLLIVSVHAGELHTVPGTSLTYYIVNDGQLPKTAFILFPGGDGADHVRIEDGKVRLSKNFLVRTAPTYASAGFTTVIVSSTSGMSDDYRQSSEQATHVQSIINHLAKLGVDKFFLVGTSRGTMSVASLVNKLTDSRIKGIIMTATVNKVNLTASKVPVLFIHHVNDGCKASPFQDAKRLSKRLNASFVEVSGGLPPETDPCKALSPHGFFGVETVVTDAMISWAKKQ